MNSMSIKNFFLSLGIALFLLLPATSFSWGVTGHRVVAEIAQTHLTKKAKRNLKKLIGTENLEMWANWPDFIKSDSTWKHADPWHYVDLPGHMEKEAFITALKKLPGKNLYTQIYAMIDDLKNKNLAVEKRQLALRFLIHLVGDLHQPLHVGRDEDAGGNKIAVTWFDKRTNLHSLWDVSLIDFQQYSFTEYTRMLNTIHAGKVKDWQGGTLEDWFYDSHQASDVIYDNTIADSKIGYQYNYKFVGLLNEQLLKGGVRLAAILNKALK